VRKIQSAARTFDARKSFVGAMTRLRGKGYKRSRTPVVFARTGRVRPSEKGVTNHNGRPKTKKTFVEGCGNLQGTGGEKARGGIL